MDTTTAPSNGLKVRLMSWFKSTKLPRHTHHPDLYPSSSSEVTLLQRSRRSSSFRTSNSSRPLSTDVSFLTSSVPVFRNENTHNQWNLEFPPIDMHSHFPLTGFRRSYSCERYQPTVQMQMKNGSMLLGSLSQPFQQQQSRTGTFNKGSYHVLKRDDSMANKENVLPLQRKSILKSSVSSSDCLSENHSLSSGSANQSALQKAKGHITFEDQQSLLPRSSTATILGNTMYPATLSQSTIDAGTKKLSKKCAKIKCLTDSSGRFLQDYKLTDTQIQNKNRNSVIGDTSKAFLQSSHHKTSLITEKCLCKTVEGHSSKPSEWCYGTPTIKTLCSECQVRLKHKTSRAVRTRILTERTKRKNILYYVEPDMSASRLLLNRWVRLKDEEEQNAVLADDERSVACSCNGCCDSQKGFNTQSGDYIPSNQKYSKTDVVKSRTGFITGNNPTAAHSKMCQPELKMANTKQQDVSKTTIPRTYTCSKRCICQKPKSCFDADLPACKHEALHSNTCEEISSGTASNLKRNSGLTSQDSVALKHLNFKKNCDFFNNQCSEESFPKTTIEVEVHQAVSNEKIVPTHGENPSSKSSNNLGPSTTDVKCMSTSSVLKTEDNHNANIKSYENLKSVIDCTISKSNTAFGTPNLKEPALAWYDNIEKDVLGGLGSETPDNFHNYCQSMHSPAVESPAPNKSILSRLVEKAVKQSIDQQVAANTLPVLQSPLRLGQSLDDLKSYRDTSIAETPVEKMASLLEMGTSAYENEREQEPLYSNLWELHSGKCSSTPDLTRCNSSVVEDLKRAMSFDCMSSAFRETNVCLNQCASWERGLVQKLPNFDKETVEQTDVAKVFKEKSQDHLEAKENHRSISLDGLDAIPSKIVNCTMGSENCELIDELIRLGKGLSAKLSGTKKTPTKKIKYRAMDVLSGKAKLKLNVSKNGSLITINVLRAASLSSSRCHIVNCYVKVSLNPDDLKRTNWRTNVIKGSNNPSFNQSFSFELLPEDGEKRLTISVWHRDIINRRSEFLGCMTFGIQHIIEETQRIRGWYRLLTETVGMKKHFAARRFQMYEV